MFTISFYTLFGATCPQLALQFATLAEAVVYGQGSGRFYEIRDATGTRVVDWEEVNVRVPGEWVYDDEEQLWKRHREEEDVVVARPGGTRRARPREMEAA